MLSLDIDLRKYPHLALIGNSGMGKTTVMHRMGEYFYDLGYKVIKIGEINYLESLGFTKECTIESIVRFMKSQKVKPKTFPVEFYHPLSSELPLELPEMIKLFSIPVKVFKDENFIEVISDGTATKPTQITISKVAEELTDKDSFPILPIKIMKQGEQRLFELEGIGDSVVPFYMDTSRSVASSNRILYMARKIGVFSSTDFEYNLENKIKEILTNNKITTFTTAYLPKNYQSFSNAIYYYILSLLIKYNRGKTVILINDAQHLFGNNILADFLSEFIKELRKSGIHFIIDFQKPWDIHRGIRNEVALSFVFRTKMQASQINEYFPEATSGESSEIPSLSPHHFYIFGMSRFRNKVSGFKLTCKLSDMVKDKNDEDRFVQGMKHYKTKVHFDKLVENWKRKNVEYIESLRITRTSEMLREYMNNYNLSENGMTILVAMYNFAKENKKWPNSIELSNSCNLSDGIVKRELRHYYDTLITRTKTKPVIYEFTKEGVFAIKEIIQKLKDIDEEIELHKDTNTTKINTKKFEYDSDDEDEYL